MKRIGLGVLVLLLAIGGSASDVASQEDADREEMNTLLSHERRQSYVLLFDGETLDGWTNRGTAEWKVVDGTITPTPGTGEGHLATNRSFGNFHLLLDFWVDETANSGVYLRVPESEPATVDNSFEVQIFDAGPEWQTGSIVNVAPASQKVETVGQWNSLDVLAIGGHLTVVVNGTEVVDVNTEPRLPSGPIVLAPNSRGELKFRNIRALPF